jgi:charged multivesicular body protein 6
MLHGLISADDEEEIMKELDELTEREVKHKKKRQSPYK